MSIEQYPPSNGVLTSLIWRKTAVGGETTLSGYDNGNQALSYTPGQEQVYLNGILLVRAEDYTATNGTSITGLSALTAGDYIQINCYNNFSVATIPATSITGTISNTQLASASTSSVGIVQLTDSTSSTSTTTAATPNSVKSAYDLANGAIPKTLTTTTGDIIYASSANTPDRLGIGSSGNVLTVSGGLPVWSDPASSGGLTLITTQSYSGVSSQSLNDVFSSTYTNYRIIINNDNSGLNNLRMRLRVSGSDNTTNDYATSFYYRELGGAGTGSVSDGFTTSFAILNDTSTDSGDISIDLYNPFETKDTTGTLQTIWEGYAGPVWYTSLGGMYFRSTTSFTGFTIFTASNNITGTVSVYGYKK